MKTKSKYDYCEFSTTCKAYVNKSSAIRQNLQSYNYYHGLSIQNSYAVLIYH